jgi:REP element-mobilizing transposase RayT
MCELRASNFEPRFLTVEQRTLAETVIPNVCVRGGWNYRICAAAEDHIHLLCDILPAIHGEKVRRLLKRWVGQELSKGWPLEEGATWWAEEGSNIAVKDVGYLNNVFGYIWRQRKTPFEG